MSANHELNVKYFMDLTGQKSLAVFSQDMKYRYRLSRIWDDTKPTIAFVMLNPSTADESKNDPTVARCQNRAAMMGYGTLEVLNIFAFRSTDPKLLYGESFPIGPHNDQTILSVIKQCDFIICAWGRHGAFLQRGKEVLRSIAATGMEIHVLKVNDDGQPGHPLYLGYERLPYLYGWV